MEIKEKVSAFKMYDGSEVRKSTRVLPDPAPVADEDEYQKLKLDNHILPRKTNTMLDTYIVNSSSQPLKNCDQNNME